MNESAAKTVLTIIGILFTAIGILGFFNQPVLGIFAVNTSHNLIHLLTGIVAFWTATQDSRTIALTGWVFATVYAVVTVLGFISTDNLILGFLRVNQADNYLHLLTTAAFG